MIFDSTDRSLSLLSKNTFSLISHLNSSSNLTKLQKISRKYLNSLWIRPVFTIIPLNSLLIPQIGKFGIIFDTRPCEIDDLAVTSRQCPSDLSEDQGPRFHHAIGRPLCRHIIAHINRAIATRSDGFDYATSPEHYKILKKSILNYRH